MRSTRLARLCLTTLIALAGVAQAQSVPGQGTWESSLQSRDINGDGNIDAYYDTSLDMTWLADANVAGRMSWSEAVSWTASLNVHGLTGWQLPSTSISGWGRCNYFTGGGDCGIRPVTTSPMAHMFYVTLGNEGYSNAGLTNTGPFSNLQNLAYWSSTLTPDPGLAWDFFFGGGSLNYVHTDYRIFAWATLQGDVPAQPIPEPSTYALMLAGLLAVIAAAKRRRAAAPSR
jgi:PEP-CTERM motif